MDRSHEDQELRAAFDAVRDEVERKRVPDFDRMLAEAKSRAVFSAARAEAEQRLPDFEKMMAAAREQASREPALEVADGGSPNVRRRRGYRVAGVASLATAAAAAALIFGVDGRDAADAEFERMVAEYSTSVASGLYASPTSALLDVPGMELTRSVPSFRGVLDDMPPASGSAPEGRDS